MLDDVGVWPGLIKRFAVVKLWPEIKTAEDECIARLKLAAAVLGIECVEITADGTLLGASGHRISNENVDFVIHLHYDTPKQYDAFSFVALWNPTRFYHEWGYARCSRNLTSHDDFLSCSSEAADDHVRRMVRNSATHSAPLFKLYHSTPDIVSTPSLGEHKLFYAGINWEAITGGKSRHQEVLKRLDGTGRLRIYGPTVFQGVRVWAGYQSYVGEVPFDGLSMMKEISKAGIALVLSSQAHKDSGLMSNRLFESIAAGALVICDENPFAKKFFGDSLLYVDGRAPVDELVARIIEHLDWAAKEPGEALRKISEAQAIFAEGFTLSKSLQEVYAGLNERKQSLRLKQNPSGVEEIRVRLCFLMPEYSPAVLQAHLRSAGAQCWTKLHAVLAVDLQALSSQGAQIKQAVHESGIDIDIVPIAFFTAGPTGIKSTRKLGEVVFELLAQGVDDDGFMVVAPNESLSSNHVFCLAAALQRNPEINCAATAAVLRADGPPASMVHETLDFGYVNPAGPTGYGRFIFRTASIPQDIGSALRYLHGRPLAVLAGDNHVEQLMFASIEIDLAQPTFSGGWDDGEESAVIEAFSPDALTIKTGFGAPHRAALGPPPGAARGVLVLRRLFSPVWIRAQLAALRRQGLSARFKALKRRLLA